MKYLCLILAAGLLLAAAVAATAAPQAICVRWQASEYLAHETYSGASITLKGIARGGATQFRWDYGDGGGTSWAAITDPYNLGVQHAYTGEPGHQFVATLHVKDAAAQESSDTYPVRVLLSSDLSDPNQLDVRVHMARDKGLWYLHTRLNRGTYPAGAPGYAEPYGWWDYGGYPLAATGAGLDAFQVNGHKVNGDYDGDPYVETAERAINYVLVHTYSTAIGVQPAGNPDTNSNGIGLFCDTSYGFNSSQTYIGGICVSAVANCGAPEQVAAVGGANVYNRKYKDIVQDMVDFFAWGQCDSGKWRGGWHYYGNQSDADMSTTQWPPLAMMIAERPAPDGMGATVPQFVRDQLPNFLSVTQISECTNDNGGFGYYSEADEYPNCSKAGAGLICFEFLFLTQPLPDAAKQAALLADPRFQKAIGFVYRHWNDSSGDWSYEKVFGNSYGTFAVSKALRVPVPSIARLTQYDCTAGHQTGNTFDWFYTPAGQDPTLIGMATYYVNHQQSDGHWDDSVGPNAVSGAFSTAWTIQSLTPGVVITPPVPVICDCDKNSSPQQGFLLNEDIALDGSCSYHPDPNGQIVSWDWYFCDPAQPDCQGEVHIQRNTGQMTIVGGYHQAGTYPVRLYVTDATGLIGGPYTCSISVHAPPHCPFPYAYPSADPSAHYNGWVNVAVTLDGSMSWDPNGDPLTYDWDLDGDGQFDDATGLHPQRTWTEEGTFTIGLMVTDQPPAPFLPCSEVSFTTVAIGNHPPIADPGGPYQAVAGHCISLDGEGSDPDPGDVISYAWDKNCLGQFTDGNAISLQFCVPPDAPVGTVYCVSLKVTDDHGKYDIKSTTVTVISDETPPVITVTPDSGSYQLGFGNCLTVTFSAEDSESGVATLLATLNSSPLNSGDGICRPGVYHLVVDAVDNAGNPAREERDYQVFRSVDPIPVRQAHCASSCDPRNGINNGFGGITGDVISSVPGVFSFDPGGPDWRNFVPAFGVVDYTVTNVSLRKTVTPYECSADIGGKSVFQHGTANITTWWPLMYELPGTTFTLTITYTTVSPFDDDGPGPHGATLTHVQVWTWSVGATLQGMKDLLGLFHELPLGTHQVPLVSDEVLYPVLQAKLDHIIALVLAGQTAEAAIALDEFVLEVEDACISIFTPRTPIASGQGTGIANTCDNPACCKILADADWVAIQLGLRNP